MKLRAVFVACVAAVASLMVVAVASADVPAFCLPGTGVGQCNGPQGVAVDTSAMEAESGHVYVADRGNNRVNVFQSDGTLPSSFPAAPEPTWVAVDNDATSPARHDVYISGGEFAVRKVKPGGELIEALGSKGNGPCQLERPDDPVATSGGNLYVADSYDKDGPGGLDVYVNRVIAFDATGACLGETLLFEGVSEAIRNFAVDSDGNFYVTVAGAGGALRKYSPAGSLLAELDKGTETEGVAVDGADNVYAKQRGQQVTQLANIYLISKYSPAGTVTRRFGYGIVPADVPALAAYSTPDGDLYASEGSAGIDYLSEPAPGPVIVTEACKVRSGGLGSVQATLQGEVNPEGKATTFHFEYLTQAQFEAGGYSNPGVQKSPETPLAAGVTDFELHEAALKVQGLTPEAKYHCRLVAKNPDDEAPPGLDGTFTTKEGFEFGPAWTVGVGETSATVEVEGNPLGLAAKGQVEYVSDAKYQLNGFAEAQSAPPGEVDFGAGEEMQLRSVELSGLTPGMLYHWRLRARNGVPAEGIVCPGQKPACPELEHTLRTYLPEPTGFDDRGYELVSPAEKNSAEVAVPGVAAGFKEERAIRMQAGAGSGEAVTYTSWTSFGEAQGAPATSQYLSKRTASGWSTENISPFGFEFSVLVPPFSGFSPDLATGAVKVSEPSLAAGCPEGFENLYLRDNTTGILRCLTPEIPDLSPSQASCFNYAGANADGSRAFFAATFSYAGAPKSEGSTYGLYEWSAAEGKLRAVSVLPGQSEAVVPTKGTAFGPGGDSFSGTANCQVGQSILRNAISTDGTRALWTYVPEEGVAEPTRLLVRVGGTETVQLDKVQSGGGKAGNGVFWAASADGSVVYFTDENRLIAGSKSEPGEPDLYRYEIDKPLGTRLTNLTKGPVAGDVKGVIGASDDGSYVYFVAGAVLSGEEENEAGLKAQAGENNLYLFHEGETSFVAMLSSEDNKDWESLPKIKTARVSPDGRHLAFLSFESAALAGYDNTIAEGGHCQLNGSNELVNGPLCSEVFVYDAEGGDLTCASCNPSGARPLGPTLLPPWSNMYEGPRYLSDSGDRVFFETYDSLLGADENGKRDVYGFERPGSGTCGAQNPNFAPISNGCYFLVSSGVSPDESFFVDASSNGRDIFFSTRSKLVGWDTNDNFDVYDYREGGGFAEPAAAPASCVGEGCKPPISPQSPAPTPATPTFTGPANVKPKPKPHKKKHKNKKHKQGKQKRNSHKQRSSR